MRTMALKGGNQQMEQYSTATSSQTEICEDNTWFSSNIAMLCGSSGGSGGRNYLAHTVSPKGPGVDVIQHGQDDAETDSHLSTFAIPRVRSDLESHSCQYPGCSIDQALNNFECQPVICWRDPPAALSMRGIPSGHAPSDRMPNIPAYSYMEGLPLAKIRPKLSPVECLSRVPVSRTAYRMPLPRVSVVYQPSSRNGNSNAVIQVARALSNERRLSNVIGQFIRENDPTSAGFLAVNAVSRVATTSVPIIPRTENMEG
ncbi:hypothetical protein N7448_011033 [Penicillium atrosanguineum]|nr:hypothetical protein N7448_011033 [Penicillium atrosanguineum]